MRRSLRRLLLRLRAAESNDEEEPLPDGWAEELDVDTLDYLYAESRARLLEQIQGIDSVSAKAKAVAGFAALVILATGILGDLQISFTEHAVSSTLSVAAIAAFVGAITSAGVILWPQPVRTGVLPIWLGEYARSNAGASLLKAAVVEIQINAFRRNQTTDVRNGRLLTATMTFTALEMSAIVALFVVRATNGANLPA